MTSNGLVSTDLPKNRDSHFWQALITTNPTSKATYKLFLWNTSVMYDFKPLKLMDLI